jgi:hypothetical protein
LLALRERNELSKNHTHKLYLVEKEIGSLDAMKQAAAADGHAN